jgi:hypothetical protein
VRNLLTVVVVIAGISGCTSAGDESQPAANATDPYAGMPSFLGPVSADVATRHWLARAIRDAA